MGITTAYQRDGRLAAAHLFTFGIKSFTVLGVYSNVYVVVDEYNTSKEPESMHLQL